MIRMIRLLIFIIVLLPICSLASPFLITDPQPAGEAGSYYEIQINDGEWIRADRSEDNGQVSLRHDIGPMALADGDYVFLVRACNVWECGPSSDPFETKKKAPGKPASPSLTGE